MQSYYNVYIVGDTNTVRNAVKEPEEQNFKWLTIIWFTNPSQLKFEHGQLALSIRITHGNTTFRGSANQIIVRHCG